MFKIFSKQALLELLVDEQVVCKIHASDIPCEKEPISRFELGAIVQIRGQDLKPIFHPLSHESGYAHFSIRISAGRACQIDCAITPTDKYDPSDILEGRASGVRFQPFMLPGAKNENAIFTGRGLFFRGLHYAGKVTPGNVSLSCICDACAESFRLQSFHAGFSQVGYFYSSSGVHTLTVPESVWGAPPALGKPDLASLHTLEARLPPAPDGTAFSYWNSLRCPHCAAPFIDFQRFPEQREGEYYGNSFMGSTPMRYEAVATFKI